MIFPASSQVISESPLWIETGAVTLELWFETRRRQHYGNNELISLVDRPGVARLLIGQFRGGLLLRGRLDNPTGDPMRDLYSPFEAIGELRHLAVTIGSEGAQVYANGRLTPLALHSTIAEFGVPFGGRIVLGTTDSGWHEWPLGVFAVAVHERMLTPVELAVHAYPGFRSAQVGRRADGSSKLEKLAERPGIVALYLFDEGEGSRAASLVREAPDLILPEKLVRPLRSTLLSGSFERRWSPRDIAQNVLGFLPLGFLIAWGRGWRGVWLAFAGGALLSLGVELAQIWVPGRDSSAIDLICNGSGGLIGGAIAALLTHGRNDARE